MTAIPKGYKQISTPNYTPEQISQFQALLGQVGQYGPQAAGLLGKLALGDDSAHQAMSQPAINQFQQQLLPDIASRFSSHGTQDSTYFRNAAAGAAGNLSSDLNAQRANIQQQSLQRLLGLEGDLLNYSPYNYGLEKKQQGGFWGKLKDALGIGADVASLGSSLFGGSVGSGIGGLASKLFGNRSGSSNVQMNPSPESMPNSMAQGASLGMDAQGSYNPAVLENMFSEFSRAFDKRNPVANTAPPRSPSFSGKMPYGGLQ